ncbi:beta-N-acetylhexosaminidase [Sulfuriroseicoccus oceanibius]|uniref:beta-N-acetylhexosaminidase n=1 Tax=Sulfuriroseicoccus oceanibius TaxID=2707525 RepID=A0A7T7JBB4_9BACT|nr:beta-N-acetylhexosaminidase [Sulfuriroseicoccus oceanibius]QQL44020.1 beta-N-acetylhexosaminidase [Sulfuriroseicoccus oceanibius]
MLASTPPSIIPKPSTLTLAENASGFTLGADTTIVHSPELKAEAALLADYLKPATGFELKTVGSAAGEGGVIELAMDPSMSDNTGAYSLAAKDGKVTITGTTPAAVFYGIQSLRQILPVEILSDEKVDGVEWSVPAVEVKDEPRFGWRGMHLDVGRHMFEVDDIKKFIDLLALHKLSNFHWHLTEDQGWRVEIKKYPKLTEVGAWRKSTPPYGDRSASDGKRYGGFYTQEQIKEIVAYAAERHITIVPEIDMPGHMAAAIASYPEFGNTDVPNYAPEVCTSWGVHPYVLSPTEETFQFVDDVLGEICELFPSEYIHIGGDEAPKTQWQQSKIAQDVIKREGLKDEHELQSYFIRRVEKMLNKRGRRLIGWDEIREGGLSPSATVMSWRGVGPGIASAKEGNDVVMAPNSHTYFDHYQAPSAQELAKGVEFEAIGGYLPITKLYDFDPVLPGQLTEEENDHVLGVQAQLWTEYMKTWDKVEYMAFPRVAALSEIAWTQPSQKDFKDFAGRLETMMKRYEALGVNAYSDPIPLPPQSLPGTSVDTSLPSHGEYHAVQAHDGKPDTVFWSSRGPQVNDHLTVRFDEPSKGGNIRVFTGGDGKHAGDTLRNGVVEVTSDDSKWVEVAKFDNGMATGEVPAGTLAVRMRATGNQENWLIVKEVVIEEVRRD